MKKRIIALILSLVMLAGVLPAQAFAASFEHTTEGKKASRKAEVTTPFTGYKQSVIDYVDNFMYNFENPDYYSKEVWDTAQNLYKTEIQRISNITSLDELLDFSVPSFFGYTPNPTTLKVALELGHLSELKLSVYKQPSDMASVKNDLKSELTEMLKEYHRANFNDFYWDRVVSARDEIDGWIDGISSPLEYADFMIRWSEMSYFEDSYAEDDSSDIEAVLYKYIVSNDELANVTESLSDILNDYIETYLPSRGYKGDTDKLYDIVEKFEEKAEKAFYARQLVDIADNYYLLMILYTGVDPTDDFSKPLANNSDITRLWDKMEKYFISTYTKSNYSESGWEKIIDIKDDYEQKLSEIKYKEDLKVEQIYNDFVKELAGVDTYAKELKQLKADNISDLKSTYLGNPKYNQTKVKPIIAEATKKINAATKTEQVESLFKTYSKKANATINKYKITTSKSGAGAVSASKTVNYGSNYTLKFVPKAGYKIKAITVDGKRIKLVNSYTFKNIKKSHSVKVTFGK